MLSELKKQSLIVPELVPVIPAHIAEYAIIAASEKHDVIYDVLSPAIAPT